MSATHPRLGVLRWMLGCALAVSSTANAVAVVDQSQNALDLTSGRPAIGGTAEQMLAQIVTVGLDGPLTAVELPVACSAGTLIVEIVELDGELPGATVLASAAVAAADLPPGDPSAFRTIHLEDRPLHRQSIGDRYAIVLRNPTGLCGLTSAPAGETYPAGDGFFDANFNPGGWLRWGDTRAAFDFPFRTLVIRPGGGGNDACVVHGLALPFPRFNPVCRCLSDAGLREFRCALLHPGIFAFRKLPSPIAPGKAFPVEWTVMPLVPLDGPVEIEDNWPAGFQSSQQGPLVFPGQAMKVGEAQTLTYQVVAPQQRGRHQIKTEVLLPFGPQPGIMENVVEVFERKTP